MKYGDPLPVQEGLIVRYPAILPPYRSFDRRIGTTIALSPWRLLSLGDPVLTTADSIVSLGRPFLK
jgi:hypothetical protein